MHCVVTILLFYMFCRFVFMVVMSVLIPMPFCIPGVTIPVIPAFFKPENTIYFITFANRMTTMETAYAINNF